MKQKTFRDFWSSLKKFENEITAIYFELIKPNMANISGKVSDGLKIIQTNTNGHELDLSIKAPKGQVLENLNEKNIYLKDVAEYSSEGGGNPPQISIKNLRGKKSTIENQETITIEIEEIKGDGEEGVKIIEQLRKGLN